MITDTHAHLFYPEIAGQLDEILSRAKEHGIQRVIVPAVDIETSKNIIKLSEKYEMLYCAIGVHPCDVNKTDILLLDEIEKLTSHEKVVAVGETGLDYYWDKSNIEKQKDFFRLQIEIAKSTKLPVVIHTRNSIADSISIIKENYDENLSGQFHCFSGDYNELSEILSMDNFYVSYCGNITYKNFSGTEIVRQTPLNKLLSETDSPFLAPVPFRGKSNEPSYIVHTLKKIAEIKNIEPNELLISINKNVSALFNL